jgi:poly(A) polymerase
VAFDVVAGRIADPLSGLSDLRAGRLRLPRPGVFRDDPVRSLRAARFLAQFPEFRLTPRTRRAARATALGLRRATPERVFRELDRMMVSSAPHRGLDALTELGLIDSVLPELAAMRDCVAGAGRPDVWRHTVDAVAFSAGPRRLPGAALLEGEDPLRVLRWALLLHDVSKPETHSVREDGRPAFHGHEVLGARRAGRILRRLLAGRVERRRIVRLIRWHLRPGHLADAGAPARGMRRLVREAGDDLPILVFHAACDARASGGPESRARWSKLRGVLRDLLDLRARARATPLPQLVDGRDVMRLLRLEPGPRVGRLLERVVDLQESGELRTRAEALAYLEGVKRPGRTGP